MRSILILMTLMILPAMLGCQALDKAPTTDLGSVLAAGPPSDAPALFAPGVVNRGLPCRDVAVVPAGDVLVWCELVGNFHHAVITEVRRTDGAWGEPRVAPFSGDPRYKDFEPAFSPDGSRLFFVSDRPESGDGPPEEFNNIWVVDRTEGGWGEPVRLPDSVNEGDSYFPSVTLDGTLYLTRNLPTGGSAVFRSRLVDGAYGTAELLPDQVNAGRSRFNAMVDAQDRFLIVPVVGLEDTRGGVDYYLVAHNADDTWAEPVNLGDMVNSEAQREWSLSLSPDGRWLFFMSDRGDPALTQPAALTREGLRGLHNAPGTGQSGIWWVDAHAVDVLRPYLQDG